MKILPILIVRCPPSYTEAYRNKLYDLFTKDLEGQYNIFVISESKPMVSMEFEVYGVSNTVNQIADLMPIDQIKTMHKEGQGPEK